MTERAFAHLKRSLIVDAAFGEKWASAFESGERACEQLGAVQLLLHGVWTFKTDAAGERTDLILGEPLNVDEGVRRAAGALVLTEWKIVKTESAVIDQCSQALVQARRYVSGVLAGFEVAAVKYLVIVSKRNIAMPADVTQEGAIYRYVNIPIAPVAPSKSKA